MVVRVYFFFQAEDGIRDPLWSRGLGDVYKRQTWGAEGDLLKLEIDPKSHSAWTGGKQKLMDKGRISKFNKKFQNFRSENKN